MTDVRYCPNCSRIGEVPPDAVNCCPDADPNYISKDIALQAKYGFRQRLEQQCTLAEPMITAIIEQAIVNNSVYAATHQEGHGYQNEGKKVDYRVGPMFCHIKVAGDTIRMMKKAGVKFV